MWAPAQSSSLGNQYDAAAIPPLLDEVSIRKENRRCPGSQSDDENQFADTRVAVESSFLPELIRSASYNGGRFPHFPCLKTFLRSILRSKVRHGQDRSGH